MIKIALIDLDGVLVDFISGVESRLGEVPPGQGVTWDVHNWYGMDEKSFWILISDFFFWADLPKYGDGAFLVSQLIENNLPFFFCSTPSLSPESAKGKLWWLQRYYPEYSRRYILTPHKLLLSNPKHLLVDDKEENVKSFAEAGGKSVLWGRPWNSAADSDNIELTETIIRYLTED